MTLSPISLSDYCSSFDHVYHQVMLPFFGQMNDGRAFNQSYSLQDCLKAGVKLWDVMRAVIKILIVDSMKHLFSKISDMYCIRLI